MHPLENDERRNVKRELTVTLEEDLATGLLPGSTSPVVARLLITSAGRVRGSLLM